MTSTVLRSGLIAGGALLLPQGVAAQTGTVAGTTVSNTAQASYTVNGTAQTTQSNTATFVVDRKVNLTVIAAQNANTQVNLGQTGAVTTFTVTNTTNGTQDFLLDADQAVGVGILPGSDNYDLTNVHVYVDANANGIYDPGTDTASFIDELAPDASRTVFIVGDVPGTTGTNLAFVSLRATVAAGGASGTQGAALVPSVTNSDTEVDIVFADNDSDGVVGLDTARNGQGRAYAAYEVGVRNVALTVTKSSRVLADGVSLTNPKALPGATVEYCLVVRNATLLVPANGIALTDVVPANTTYVPGSIQVGAFASLTDCVTGGFPQNDDGSNAIGPYTGSYTGATRTVNAGIPLLPGGTSVAASFRVTIN